MPVKILGKTPRTIALVVAAGRGRRLGAETPKQYVPLAGHALLFHAAAALPRHPRVDRVRVVIGAGDRPLHDRALASLDLLDPVVGGDSRQDSVRLGLESLEALSPDRVLIHDAARPALDAALVDRVLDALDAAPGAIPALPVTDSLKRVAEDGRIKGAVERAGLWRAQTPQGFRFAEILAAHRRAAGLALTDDAAVAEAAGLAVAVVAGSAANVKVTGALDHARAERLMGLGREARVGQGFDVHAFGPRSEEASQVTLCGVEIPHERGLVGVSDADVGLHALVDAVLGALGAGDIGDHFPPSDPARKGADSRVFAAAAPDLVAKAALVEFRKMHKRLARYISPGKSNLTMPSFRGRTPPDVMMAAIARAQAQIEKNMRMLRLLRKRNQERSEEHTSELQSHSFISYAVFCLKKKKTQNHNKNRSIHQRSQHLPLSPYSHNINI